VKIRERIREQSRQVAEYMAGQGERPKRYQVLWDCPKCGNSHTWWWEDEFEAHAEGEHTMVCDRCDERVLCVGDGHGYYTPVAEEAVGRRRTTEQINATLDELQSGRRAHLSMLTKLSVKADELDDLNTDLHNYVRELEDKVNGMSGDLYAAVNSLAKHVARIEEAIGEHRGELDNVGRRLTTAELAIANLEEGVRAETYSDRARKPKSIIDLIHGERPPFHERFREGCGFNEETMPGETLAKILRFVAVEVERMTERDMGGSFTVSNLKVGENLRELADEVEGAQ